MIAPATASSGTHLPDRAPAALELAGVGRRRAGRPAVAGLDLRVENGQVLGLLGANGAGKSTTLAMIAGALWPDQGRVCLGGVDLREHPALARRRIGWLPERAPLWPELTLREHVLAHGRLRGLRGNGLTLACAATLARLDLGALAQRLAGTLSQGQRQRLGLACALLHQPDVLVLDEPANALDPVQVLALRRVLREEAAAGRAVVLSTHVLAEVSEVCDRVAILHEGKLCHAGPVDADPAALARRFFAIAGQPEAPR